jgi:hypothetical protein
MAATFSPVSSLLVSSATSSNPLRSRVAFVAARAKKHNNNNNNTRRFLAPRAEGGSSSSYGEKASYGVVPRHNVAIGGFNPTGGDASMDEARVVDPYGCVGGRVSFFIVFLEKQKNSNAKSSQQLTSFHLFTLLPLVLSFSIFVKVAQVHFLTSSSSPASPLDVVSQPASPTYATRVNRAKDTTLARRHHVLPRGVAHPGRAVLTPGIPGGCQIG